MLELTSTEGLPLFLNIMCIESIQQLKNSTLIITYSGTNHVVNEHASDVITEISNYAAMMQDSSDLH